MMRTWIPPVCLAVGLLAGCNNTNLATTASAGLLTTPKAEDPLESEDWEILRGVWETDAKAKPWVRLYFGEPVAAGSFARVIPPSIDRSPIHIVETKEWGTFDGLIYEAIDRFKFGDGEKGKYIAIDAAEHPASGRTLSYRVEGAELHLTVAEGGLKGEHRLQRVKDVKPAFEEPDK
jgi:hypothetical protein